MRSKKTALLIALSLMFFSHLSHAEIGLINLGNGSSVAAPFPCKPMQKQVKSPSGVLKGLDCSVDDGYNFCHFLLSAQDLDQSQFNKHGMKWIAAVHSAYAEQIGTYKQVYAQTSSVANIGPSLTYELLRMESGVDVQVNGIWIVSGSKVLRATTSCGRRNPNYLKSSRKLFLTEISVIR